MYLNMNNNSNNVHLEGIMIPLGLRPSQARASNQCRASNRQTQASNNHNALQMNVIVVFNL